MSFVTTLAKTSLAKTSFPSQWSNGQGKGAVRKNGDNDERGYNPNQFSQQRRETAWEAGHSYNISCEWEPFKQRVIAQWGRITVRELDEIGPNRSKVAMLIENKYGVAAHLVENYLRNFERTLPLI